MENKVREPPNIGCEYRLVGPANLIQVGDNCGFLLIGKFPTKVSPLLFGVEDILCCEQFNDASYTGYGFSAH